MTSPKPREEIIATVSQILEIEITPAKIQHITLEPHSPEDNGTKPSPEPTNTPQNPEDHLSEVSADGTNPPAQHDTQDYPDSTTTSSRGFIASTRWGTRDQLKGMRKRSADADADVDVDVDVDSDSDSDATLPVEAVVKDVPATADYLIEAYGKRVEKLESRVSLLEWDAKYLYDHRVEGRDEGLEEEKDRALAARITGEGVVVTAEEKAAGKGMRRKVVEKEAEYKEEDELVEVLGDSDAVGRLIRRYTHRVDTLESRVTSLEWDVKTLRALKHTCRAAKRVKRQKVVDEASGV